MTSVVVNAQPTKCSTTPLFARMNSCAPSPQLPYGGDDFSRRQCPTNQMLHHSAIRTNEFMRSFPSNPYGGDDFSRRQCPANQMLRPSAIRTNEFMRSFPSNPLRRR